MSAQIIMGQQIADKYKARIKEEVHELRRLGVQPGLSVILVGDDPASQVYVRNKATACEKVGIRSQVIRLPEETSEGELLQMIAELNRNSQVHGILVQLPLPRHIAAQAVIKAISPEKDVDGFHPVSAGNLLIGTTGFYPCTPAGIMVMLQDIGFELSGKHAVVVGRSNIVGKPMAVLLLQENATVTICHSKTESLEQITRQADLLIAAVGQPRMITKQHVKPGAVVIDVGMNRLADGRLTGDVDFEQVREIASYITPVPKGVGPMTIAMLLANTLAAAKRTVSS